MANSHANDSGLFAGSLSMPDFWYEHTHSSCSGRFYSYVKQFKSHAGRNHLSNENLYFHTALLHFWKCIPSFLSNPVLLNTDTSLHRQKHPVSAENWGISQTSIHVGALSAFPHHGGNMEIFGNMKTSPSFCSWGCWGSHSPFFWELLLGWASAVWPWPEPQLLSCLASASLTLGLWLPQGCPDCQILLSHTLGPLGTLETGACGALTDLCRAFHLHCPRNSGWNSFPFLH